MANGSWLNADNLLIQYGAQKAIPSTAGDYLSYGETREIETLIYLAGLTTTPQLIDLTTFMPAGTQTFIEQVETVCEIGATGGTSFSVGLGYPTPGTTTYTTNSVSGASLPAVTVISNTAFINAMAIAQVTTAGQKTILAEGTTAAGAYIGAAGGAYLGSTSATTTFSNYLTALAAGTFTAGVVRVRIKYRGLPPITQ